MSELSRYVDYLPPVLWSPEYDSEQFLGRMLRIFEKILSGITIDAQAVRASASFDSAGDRQITFTDFESAAVFRKGDTITIEGSGVGAPDERSEIEEIELSESNVVFSLTSTLSRDYSADPDLNVRIADLEAGQRKFRVDEVANLGPGIPVQIRQGANNEVVVIDRVENGFIHLRSGLTGTYWTAEEKVPVRLSDAQPLVSMQEMIDSLHELFNPWTTRADPEFLDWLASWVALALREEWSDYQKRKLIGEMVTIYQQRGLKRGLQTYLDIYAAHPARPRIAIDCGEAIFRASFTEDGTACLYAVAHSQSIQHQGMRYSLLHHPMGLAVDRDNNYIVVTRDAGRYPAMLWRLSSLGEVDYVAYVDGSSPPRPEPRYPRPPYDRSFFPLFDPRAVVVRDDDYYVLEGGAEMPHHHDAGIYRFRPNYVESYPLTPPELSEPLAQPVDMVLDRHGRFIVLDAGSDSVTAKILQVTSHPFSIHEEVFDPDIVKTPTALVMDPNGGHFIVADANKQDGSEPAQLIKVTPHTGARWVHETMLDGVENNPLVLPTGLAFESSDILYVCDAGLRRGHVPASIEEVDPDYRSMAEPAAIYRVDLAKSPPEITRVTAGSELVYPMKMIFDRLGRLIIIDRGADQNYPFPNRFVLDGSFDDDLDSGNLTDVRPMFEAGGGIILSDSAVVETLVEGECWQIHDNNWVNTYTIVPSNAHPGNFDVHTPLSWRAQQNQFGVTVHFSQERQPEYSQRKEIRRAIAEIVEQEKPCQSAFWMDFW